MEWSFRAWERAPEKRVVAVVAMVVAGVAGYFVLNHALFALLGAGVVFVSTAEMFLPVCYRLDKEQARQRCGISVTAIRWDEVKRLIPQGDGVRLSPFESPHKLDAFRGLFLRYAGNEDEVLGKIRELWQIDGISLERAADPRTEGGDDRETCGRDSQASAGDASDLVP